MGSLGPASTASAPHRSVIKSLMAFLFFFVFVLFASAFTALFISVLEQPAPFPNSSSAFCSIAAALMI